MNDLAALIEESGAELRFEAKDHSYHLGLIRLPSATQILREAGLCDDLSKIPAYILERKRQIGEATHMACQLLLEGSLDRETVPPEVLPYLTGFEKFMAEKEPAIVACEEAVYHSDLLYACRPDLDVRLDGPTLFEIKTTVKLSRYVPIQLALQAMCLGPRKRAALHLLPDGTYRIVTYQDEHDYAVAAAAVAIAKWKTK